MVTSKWLIKRVYFLLTHLVLHYFSHFEKTVALESRSWHMGVAMASKLDFANLTY